MVDIFGLLNFRGYKRDGNKLLWRVVNSKTRMAISTISATRFFTFVYQKVQRNVKNHKHSKVTNSKKSGREKALTFEIGINITSPVYSRMPENCFKLQFWLFWTQSMSDTSHLFQQNIFSDIDSHYQMFRQFFSYTVLLWYF